MKVSGKYDDVLTQARKQTQAETVVLIVINGTKGSGFSVQTEDPKFEGELPDLLRYIAYQIEVGRG